MSDYHKSLDKKGKDQFRALEAIITLPTRMDAIEPASDVLKIYEESQRVVEVDRATLADAWYSMKMLREAIEATSKLSKMDRS